MKSAIKQIIEYCLIGLLGWNRTIADAYIRHLKLRILGHQQPDEVFVVRELFRNKRDGILFDIGAHTGSFFEHFLWNRWQIYAFEPDPAEFKQSALHNFQQLDDVKVFNFAVSNESGKILPFFASEESSGISSLHSFTSGHKKVTEVKTITLSDFVREQHIDRISILKIDTEGHDYFVLQGFPWDQFKPDFIMCEFEDRKTLSLGYDFRTLGNYLVGKGYRVFVSEWEPISQYGRECKWIGFKEYPCKLEHSDGWGNFLCLNPTANIDSTILLNESKY